MIKGYFCKSRNSQSDFFTYFGFKYILLKYFNCNWRSPHCAHTNSLTSSIMLAITNPLTIASPMTSPSPSCWPSPTPSPMPVQWPHHLHHVGRHGLGSRVSSQFQAVGDICSKLIVNIDDELTFSLVLDALEADPAAALAGRTILSSMDHICWRWATDTFNLGIAALV